MTRATTLKSTDAHVGTVSPAPTLNPAVLIHKFGKVQEERSGRIMMLVARGPPL